MRAEEILRSVAAKCGILNIDDFEDMAGYAACGGQIASGVVG